MVLEISCLSHKHNLSQDVNIRDLISTSKGAAPNSPYTIIEEVSLFTDNTYFENLSWSHVTVFAATYVSSVPYNTTGLTSTITRINIYIQWESYFSGFY